MRGAIHVEYCGVKYVSDLRGKSSIHMMNLRIIRTCTFLYRGIHAVSVYTRTEVLGLMIASSFPMSFY